MSTAGVSTARLGADRQRGRADVVARVAAALAAQDMDLGPPDRDQLIVDLRWSGGRGTVALGAYEMLPDDPPVCPSDLWP